jgi:NADPH2:quinone reductase
MEAIVVPQPGPPDILTLAPRPLPAPGAGEILIRVEAAGVNRADIAQRQGRYPAPPGAPPDIPGLEVSGVVESCHPTVRRWKPGDAVCALLAGGGYAQYVTVHEGQCIPVPSGLSFTDAAALPEAACTVWHNVFQRGRLQAGENFLVHGGSSGIGMMAIQLAKAFGARVFTTAGNEAKCRACEVAGADRALNYRREDFEAALKEEGVDVILDMVGGDYAPKNLRLLRPDGRLVYINAMQGGKVELDIPRVMSRRLTVTGSTLRSREAAFKTALVAEVERVVWPLVATGRIKPAVSAIFSLAAAADAHRLMESSEHVGKIILRCVPHNGGSS